MTENGWLREFCEKTTSPGLQYLVMKYRSPIEKLVWILTFLCMISLTISSLGFFINIWMNSPTKMFIENKESPIQDIPFPKITICPSNQIRKSIWKKYENTNSSYWKSLQNYQSLICSYSFYKTQLKHEVDNFNYDLIKQLVNECAISCAEVFQSDIKWQNTTIKNVCEFVQPVITVLGLCYTLNMMPLYQMLTNESYQNYMDFFSKNNTYTNTERSKWNLDDGYTSYSDDNVLVQATPARVNGVSLSHRLELILHTSNEKFLRCPNGWKDGVILVTITNPAEYHSIMVRSIIEPDTYTKIQIKPFVKKINWDLKWRSAEARRCFLHDERKLSMFQIYSEENCKSECYINTTLSMCGCVNFEAVFLVTKNTNICGLAKIECMQRAILATFEPSMAKVCNCWPTCTLIQYDKSVSTHYDNWTYMRTTNLVDKNASGSTIEMVFKNPYFSAYEAKSIVDLYSLISTTGGILSLLLGLNLISVFEIIYFLFRVIIYYIVHMFDQ